MPYLASFLCTLALCACQSDFVALRAETHPQNQAPATGQHLIIDTTSLPGTYRRSTYSQRLQAHGGALPYHWRVEKGDLPPGIKLEDDGTLHGSPEAIGEFRFTISVTDNSVPPQSVQRDYVLTVVADLIMRWKTPPHVVNNRIDTYEAMTAELLPFYEKRGMLKRVSGVGTVEEVTKRVFSALGIS